MDHFCKPGPSRPCTCCECGRPQGGMLIWRILGSGREWQRRACLTLRVSGLPEGMMTLTDLRVCGETIWEPLPASCGNQLLLKVSIPVLCTVRDCCGCLQTGHSFLETTVALCLTCPVPECWRHQVAVLPCVRLICGATSDCGCFEATVEVLVEAYLLRPEACRQGQPRPACMDLPLFPPPCC